MNMPSSLRFLLSCKNKWDGTVGRSFFEGSVNSHGEIKVKENSVGLVETKIKIFRVKFFIYVDESLHWHWWTLYEKFIKCIYSLTLFGQKPQAKTWNVNWLISFWFVIYKHLFGWMIVVGQRSCNWLGVGWLALERGRWGKGQSRYGRCQRKGGRVLYISLSAGMCSYSAMVSAQLQIFCLQVRFRPDTETYKF